MEKSLEEGNLIARKFCNFEGNFVILREKMKKFIREICHAGGKSYPDCQEIIFFSRPVLLMMFCVDISM